MKSRLKPMNALDILDSSFSILRENFWSFQGVALKSFLPSLIILLAGGLIVGAYLFFVTMKTHLLFTDQRFWSELLQGSLVTNILIILLLIIILAAFIIAFFIGCIYFTYGNMMIFKAGLHHQKCTSKEAFVGIKEKRVRIFLVWLLMMILMYAISIPGFIGSIVFDLMLPPLGTIISFLNSILQMVISFLFLLVLPVIIFENLDVIKSFSRGFKLISGYRWKVFGRLCLVYLLSYALAFIAIFLVAIPIVIAVAAQHIIAYILAGLLIIISLFIISILISYSFGPLIAIYYDLLIRKEGYDLTLQLLETTDEGLRIEPSQTI